MSVVGNIDIMGNRLITAITKRLAAKLPPGWRLYPSAPRRGARSGADSTLRVRGPDSSSASVLVQAKQRLEPKDVDYLAVDLRSGGDLPALVIAPFLSPRTRQRLEEAGFNYADSTGNVRLSLSKPALYIEGRGADKNPEPSVRERRSLKGPKAGRLVRALCDFGPPLGIRELAKRAGVDPGYASRIVDYLDREALVVRKARGPVSEIDWPGLLRRWSQEYSPFQRGRAKWFLAARGLTPLATRLRTLSARYAVSGSWAATQLAPVAPPRRFVCYADGISNLAQSLDLRPADAGSSVALVVPFDTVVFERTPMRDGITLAAPSQVAVDLLTSPGRGPNEAEALIDWMRENEDAWRT